MCKKALGMFLAGTLFLFGSCVDETYDLANKEIAMDMQMKGNKLALPLGSLRPFVLDSLLDLESISMITVDSATRSYSLSLDSSLVTSVKQKDLSVLEEVANLSAEIEPVPIDLGEIKIPSIREEHTEELDFADVTIDNVSLPETKEEVTLAIGEIELDSIPVKGQSFESSFEIPTVNVDSVPVDRIEQSVSFAIDDIPVTSASSPAVENTLTVEMPSIPMDDYSKPALTTDTKSILNIPGLNNILGDQADDVKINSLLYTQSFDFDVTQEMEDMVGINFSYNLPEQIATLNRVVLANSDDRGKGALIEFELTNPTLLEGINNRSVSFSIQFPENYELEEYADNYTLSNNVLSVTDMSASDEKTYIRFYLKGINGLDADKFYTSNAERRMLSIKEEVAFNVTYKAKGSLKIPTSIKTIGQLREGISYSMALNSEFDIDEVYGDINAVKSDFEEKELDFSFSIDQLDYIKQINKVVLDPDSSVLRFSTTISKELRNGNCKFDLDPNSKIILSLPTVYVFDYDNIKFEIPDGVKRVDDTNDFEISTIEAFYDGSWSLPVKEVNFGDKGVVVEKGVLSVKDAKAYLKAVSGNTPGKLTVKAMNDLALIDATELLCETRSINFKADPATLTVDDVTGATNAIDIALEEKTFTMPLEINNLEHVQSVDFVQFKKGQKITLSSSSLNSFGDIKLEKDNYIALRFPEEFEFDVDDNNCSLEYDATLNAFKIDNLDALKDASWDFAIKQIDIDAEVDDNKTLKKEFTISISPVNAKGVEDTLYIAGIDNFSLDKMREDGLFKDFNITFALEKTEIFVDEVQGKTKNIPVDNFVVDPVSYTIDIKDLKYISRIGNIKLEQGSNFLEFKPSLKKDLGNFNLAQGSYIELKFPEVFFLDPANCTVPQGIEVSAHAIKVTSLKALNSADVWKLAVEQIAINKDIDGSLQENYAINVVAHDAEGYEGKLTIAAVDPFRLTDVKKAGGTNKMTFTILPTDIKIADIEASVGEMAFAFKSQVFEFPVSIPNLDKVDSVKHISFKKDANKIALNISLDGTSIEPFKLADKSVVKISFPKEFVFDTDACNIGKLEFAEDNALYIHNISDIENAKLVLALDRLQMDYDIPDNGTLEWNGSIKVEAYNTENQKEDSIYVAGVDNVTYTGIKNALSDKTLTFEIPKVEFGIEEAVIVSNTIEAEIKQDVEFNINQQFAAAIDRIDRIGFTDRVPMTLSLKANGLSDLDALVNLDIKVALPSVFDISEEDDRISFIDDSLAITMSHNFSQGDSIKLQLWVNSLNFKTLEGGFLALQPVEGKADERVLNYKSQVAINGSAAIGNAKLSSDLLNEDISMEIAFELDEIKLKDFTGIYGGTVDPVSSSFDLDLKSGFEELEKNGLTLANTKPELMITLYNTIGVPVDVDLSIIGLDENDKEIPTAVIKPEEILRIRPAKFNDKNELVADTTRWLFTSNKDAFVPGYDVVVIENLDNLLDELPHSISFSLTPTIVTKENGEAVLHYVDLTKPLELGGSYSISVPFDLQFTQAIPLDFGEEADAIIRDGNNKFTLANPQLALSIHNPIAEELAFDLSLIGKNEAGDTIPTATLFENEPFVLAAGQYNEDGGITPVATRWLFAVNDTIKKVGYETKVAEALGTLLVEIPHQIDIELNAHFNTDLVKKIDYNNDLELLCEYGVMVPLQFDNLELTYTDTIADIQFNLDETLDDLSLSISNVELAIAMNLKNTLPVGLKLDLIPLDASGNEIAGIKIGSIELPAGNGSDISSATDIKGTPVELAIKCDSPSTLSKLDKVSFNLEVSSGNGDNALTGKQGLQVCDIVLQIMCDVEIDASK